jgi:hypothetical protein
MKPRWTSPWRGFVITTSTRNSEVPGESPIDSLSEAAQIKSPMAAEHEFLRELYAAFNARDIERALSAMHHDVEWANGMEGGSVHGRKAVRDYWTRQWQSIDPPS